MTKTVEVNEGEGMYGDSLGIQIEMGWGKDMIKEKVRFCKRWVS